MCLRKKGSGRRNLFGNREDTVAIINCNTADCDGFIMLDQKKTIWSWALYDWANSAYVTIIMAGYFPVFFKLYWSAGVDATVSTEKLGLANSLSGLVLGILAPVLGAIADRGSAKKKFLLFFAFFGAVMTVALCLVQQGNWQAAASPVCAFSHRLFRLPYLL